MLFGCLFFAGCEVPKYDSPKNTSYPDLELKLEEQLKLLAGSRLIKEVRLGKKIQRDTLVMDSSSWEKELGFFSEINPATPRYVGVFNVSRTKDELNLSLNEGENGELKTFRLKYKGSTFHSLEAKLQEENSILANERNIRINFKNGAIESWVNSGYQKAMMSDIISFRIKGTVLSPK
ncbi:MAG: hypothetical protein AAF616_00655 [Bacteroidota bacterium]